MKWFAQHKSLCAALITLTVFSTLLNQHAWWAYACVFGLAVVLASLTRVGVAEDWDVELVVWKIVAGAWGFLIVFCPTMQIFFPTTTQEKLRSLSDQALAMGPIITVGLSGLAAMLLVASRRKPAA